MATELENLIVRLTGDSREYEDMLARAERATRDAADRIARERERLYSTPTSQVGPEVAAQRQAVAAQQALEEQQRAMQRGVAVTQANQTATERYAAKVAELDALLQRGAISQTTYNRAVAQAKSEMEAATASTTGWAKAMTALSVAAAGLIGSSTKEFGDFQSQLAKIEGLVGVARDQVQAWGKDILKLGVATGKAPMELANALFFITSAGLRGSAALQALEASARASTAGLGTTAAVADAVTSAVNAYARSGMTASQATDTLTAAVREGKLSAESLAPVIGRLLPLASSMGVDFQEVAGAIAAMSRTGTTAAEASTQIQGFLMSIQKPSKEARDSLAAVGVSINQLRNMVARPGGLVGAIRLLDGAFGDNEKGLAAFTPNVRALRGALNLLSQNAGVVDGVMKGVRESAGDTDKAFGVVAETLNFRAAAAFAAMRALMIDVGAVMARMVLPVIKTFTRAVKGMAFAWNELSPAAKEATAVLIGFAAAATLVGPLVTAWKFVAPLFNSLSLSVKVASAALLLVINPLKWITGGVALLKAAFVGVGVVMSAVFSPVGVAIAAVAAAVAIAVGQMGGFSNAWQALKAGASDAWAWVTKQTQAFITWVQPVAQSLGLLFSAAWQLVGDGASAAYSAVAGVLSTLAEYAAGVWSSISGGAAVNWTLVRDSIVNAIIAAEFALRNFGDVAELAMMVAYKGLVVFANEVEHFFTGTVPAVFDWFVEEWQNIFTDLYNWTGTVFQNLGTNIVGIFSNLPALLRGEMDLSDLWKPLQEGFERTTRELVLPDRIAGDLENFLTDEVDRLTGRLDRKFEEFRDGRMAGLVGAKPWKLPDVKLPTIPGLPNWRQDLDESITEPFKHGKAAAEKFDAAVRGSSEAITRLQNYMDRFGGPVAGGGGRTLAGIAGGAAAAVAAPEPAKVAAEVRKAADAAPPVAVKLTADVKAVADALKGLTAPVRLTVDEAALAALKVKVSPDLGAVTADLELLRAELAAGAHALTVQVMPDLDLITTELAAVANSITVTLVPDTTQLRAAIDELSGVVVLKAAGGGEGGIATLDTSKIEEWLAKIWANTAAMAGKPAVTLRPADL